MALSPSTTQPPIGGSSRLLELRVRAVPSPVGPQVLAVLRRERPGVRGWDAPVGDAEREEADPARAGARQRRARVAVALAATQAAAIDVREDARRAWADDRTWWDARRRGVPTGAAAAADVADLRAALAVHVRCALGTAQRPRSLALWDAALSALLLASLRSVAHDPRADDAVSDYLLLTAAFDGSGEAAADWQGPTGAAWAQRWGELEAGLRDRVVDAMAMRADQAAPDRNDRLLLGCRDTLVCERIARRLVVADAAGELGRELVLWQVHHAPAVGLARIVSTGVGAWTAAADATQLETLAAALAPVPGPVAATVRAAATTARATRTRSDVRTRAILDEAVAAGDAGRPAHAAAALRSWFARPVSDVDARRIVGDGARALGAVEVALTADPGLAPLVAAYWATTVRPSYRRLLPPSRGQRLVAVERLEYHVARLAMRLREDGEHPVAHALLADLSPDARHDLTAPYLLDRTAVPAIPRAGDGEAVTPRPERAIATRPVRRLLRRRTRPVR